MLKSQTTKEFLPKMVARKSGHVVAVAALSGKLIFILFPFNFLFLYLFKQNCKKQSYYLSHMNNNNFMYLVFWLWNTVIINNCTIY